MLATFQAIHQYTSVTGDITQDNYLYVKVVALLGTVGLMVYKSPIVTEEYPGYEPVVRTLEAFDHKVLIRETVPDSRMMFGEAEYSMYLLEHPSHP